MHCVRCFLQASASLLPTLTPSKSEVHPDYYTRLTKLVYGNKSDSLVARWAINQVMIRISVRFLGLRLPLMGGAVLLYFVATKWLVESAGAGGDSSASSSSQAAY